MPKHLVVCLSLGPAAYADVTRHADVTFPRETQDEPWASMSRLTREDRQDGLAPQEQVLCSANGKHPPQGDVDCPRGDVVPAGGNVISTRGHVLPAGSKVFAAGGDLPAPPREPRPLSLREATPSIPRGVLSARGNLLAVHGNVLPTRQDVVIPAGGDYCASRREPSPTGQASHSPECQNGSMKCYPKAMAHSQD